MKNLNFFEILSIVLIGALVIRPNPVLAAALITAMLVILGQRLGLAALELKKPPVIDLGPLTEQVAALQVDNHKILSKFAEVEKQAEETKKLMSQAQLALGFRRMPPKD